MLIQDQEQRHVTGVAVSGDIMRFSEFYESAPPGMEKWIKDRKADFKKRYGDRWQEVLYATAWKQHNKNESAEALAEAHRKKAKEKHKVTIRNPRTGRNVQINFGEPDQIEKVMKRSKK